MEKQKGHISIPTFVTTTATLLTLVGGTLAFAYDRVQTTASSQATTASAISSLQTSVSEIESTQATQAVDINDIYNLLINKNTK
jgi:hypothetical protein